MTGSWVGNTWVPTPPWRLYSVADLQALYRDRTVLWIGDSTSDRTARTHYAILSQQQSSSSSSTNSSNSTNDHDFAFLSSPQPLHISVERLEQDIDKNARSTEDCDKWKDYAYTTTTTNDSSAFVPPSYHILMCRPIEVQQEQPPPHDHDDGNATAAATTNTTVGEVAWLPSMCLTQLPGALRATVREQQLQQQQEGDGGGAGGEGPPIPIPSYDIVVIALGIWQDLIPQDCPLPANETITTVVAESIQLLTQMVTMADSRNNSNNNKRMRVIWRTGGWTLSMAHEQHKATLEMNRAIMDIIDNAHLNRIDGSSMISYVNWGDAVAPRSFGAERIVGDHVAHYGWEPRQMLVQMVTNELAQMDRTIMMMDDSNA
jgi:hypothetical protein